jgi:hypothetical protein
VVVGTDVDAYYDAGLSRVYTRAKVAISLRLSCVVKIMFMVIKSN